MSLRVPSAFTKQKGSPNYCCLTNFVAASGGASAAHQGPHSCALLSPGMHLDANGPTAVFQGAVFSLALILIVVAGAELFTSSPLLSSAVLERKLGIVPFLQLRVVVFVGNALGCIAGAALLFATGIPGYHLHSRTAYGRAHCELSVLKLSHNFGGAFVLGFLGNVLVNLAVILALASRSEIGKIWGIVFPMVCFYVMRFEHVIFNVYYFALAMMMDCTGFHTAEAFVNLVAVALGNMVGAFVLSTAYWFIYLHCHEKGVYKKTDEYAGERVDPSRNALSSSEFVDVPHFCPVSTPYATPEYPYTAFY